MRRTLDNELDSLNQQLTAMGQLCEDAIREATQSLRDGDQEQARKVIAADAGIDQAEKDIERLCLKLLLQQQPVARDLRQISAALKMITDMERIGDQASDIAEIILSTPLSDIGPIPMIIRMSEEASKMVKDSVDAYVRRDLELAGRVEAHDDIVDNLCDEIREKIIQEITADPDKVGARAIDLVMVAKYLERIADHATNIAEWVVYSITGVHESEIDTKKLS